MKNLLLADLGEGLTEATVVEYYVSPKQLVKQGDLLLAVETAKAIVEIPAPETLIVQQLLATANQVVNVGMPLLSYDSPQAELDTTPTTHDTSSVVGQLEISGEQYQQNFITGQQRFSEQERHTIQQRLLNKNNSPIIVERQHIPLSGSRLVMAQNLAQAHQQVALVTIFDEVLIKKINNPLITMIQALCYACQQQPKLNAWFDTQQLIIHQDVDLGLAIDTEYGLYVPVIKQANKLNKQQLQQAITQLKTAAHQHQLSNAQLQGATISLSNFGTIAGRFATPMIVPPQVAILGVGQIQKRYVINAKAKIKEKVSIPLSLSFDHRALTGGEAARFLAAIKDFLHNKKAA